MVCSLELTTNPEQQTTENYGKAILKSQIISKNYMKKTILTPMTTMMIMMIPTK